jgi:ankyrin repeat protein
MSKRMRLTMVFCVIVSLCLATAAYGDQSQDNALIEAARKGRLPEVQALLAKGARVNARDPSGFTPLMWAANFGHLPVVQALLTKGADVNAKDNYGILNAFKCADMNGHPQVAKFLKDKGAQGETEGKLLVDERGNVTRENKGTQAGPKVGGGPAGGSNLDNALIDAATKGDLAAVQALLAKGANVNARAAGGETPLIMAAVNGRLSVVHALLDKGADVNAGDNHGTTALMDAAEYGQLQVVQALLARGADVNAKNKRGETVLYLMEYSFLWPPDVSEKVMNDIINALRRAGAR